MGVVKLLPIPTTLDIAPTIVDQLGLPIPESWEGKSLVSGEKRAYTYHQMNDTYAIIHHKGNLLFKYVYNKKTKVAELFELTSDIYETKNTIKSADVAYLNYFKQRLRVFRIDPFL